MNRNSNGPPAHVNFAAGERDGPQQPCGRAVMEHGAAGQAAPSRRDHFSAVLSDEGTEPAVSRRDLLFAARLLELQGARLLSTNELVGAIRRALQGGSRPDRLGADIQALVDTLQLAGRPTAANGLLDTLRQAA